jgi:hypothetical protein
MANDSIEQLQFELAQLKRMVGGMVRPAAVHEVKGDKMRMVLGQDKGGQDILGPWLHSSSMRGGGRERKFFKKGQNLMLLCPNGDVSQAVVMPYAPNKDHQAPDHANESGQDEETFQLDDLRVKKTKKGYAIWLQDPKQNDQQQGQQGGDQAGGSGGGSDKEGTAQARQPQQADPRALIQLSNDGGFTARIGKDVRVSASKDGAKLKAGSNFTTVTKDKIIHKASGDVHIDAGGTPYVSKPWQIGPAPSDPVSDDDKVLDDSGDSGGGSGGSGGSGGGGS